MRPGTHRHTGLIIQGLQTRRHRRRNEGAMVCPEICPRAASMLQHEQLSTHTSYYPANETLTSSPGRTAVNASLASCRFSSLSQNSL